MARIENGRSGWQVDAIVLALQARANGCSSRTGSRVKCLLLQPLSLRAIDLVGLWFQSNRLTKKRRLVGRILRSAYLAKVAPTLGMTTIDATLKEEDDDDMKHE